MKLVTPKSLIGFWWGNQPLSLKYGERLELPSEMERVGTLGWIWPRREVHGVVRVCHISARLP